MESSCSLVLSFVKTSERQKTHRKLEIISADRQMTAIGRNVESRLLPQVSAHAVGPVPDRRRPGPDATVGPGPDATAGPVAGSLPAIDLFGLNRGGAST
jgi:hypothetical protein